MLGHSAGFRKKGCDQVDLSVGNVAVPQRSERRDVHVQTGQCRDRNLDIDDRLVPEQVRGPLWSLRVRFAADKLPIAARS